MSQRDLFSDARGRCVWRRVRQAAARPRPLPEALRSQLLEIPSTSGRSSSGAYTSGRHPRRWLPFTLRSPVLALLASYLCVLFSAGLGANPYRLGAAATRTLQTSAHPLLSASRDLARQMAIPADALEERAQAAWRWAAQTLSSPLASVRPVRGAAAQAPGGNDVDR